MMGMKRCVAQRLCMVAALGQVLLSGCWRAQGPDILAVEYGLLRIQLRRQDEDMCLRVKEAVDLKLSAEEVENWLRRYAAFSTVYVKDKDFVGTSLDIRRDPDHPEAVPNLDEAEDVAYWWLNEAYVTYRPKVVGIYWHESSAPTMFYGLVPFAGFRP